ncbi:MAG: hypothetical protein ACLTXR_08410 [Clostridia bacterium]|jgi:hypothetical protein|nr:MAG TPA: hypothetical protein [Caudoviricetes sp.]
MDKINVNLYGGKSIFGGRETPLEAEMTYCDKYKNCSFYKQGKCFSAGRWQQNCKFGKKVRQKGYTSRALKYNDFRDKYRKDECYNKLDEPNNTIGKIEDTFVINVRYLHEKEGGGYEIETNIFSHPLIYINENDFKNELISLICDGKPRTFVDNAVIKDYQEKTVPRFLYELKTEFTDIYNRFITQYPEYREKQLNFIGRIAYIYSLRDGIELKSNYSDGAKFVKEGEYLKSTTNYNGSFMPFNAKEADIRLKIDKKMSVKITDNSMVDENTIFKD